MWYIWFLIVITPITLLLYRLQLSRTVWMAIACLFTILAIFFGGPLNSSHLPLGLQHLTSLPLYYGMGIYFARNQLYKKIINRPLFLGLANLFTIFYIFYLQSYDTYPQHFLALHSLLRYTNGMAMTYLIFSILIALERRLPAFLAWFGQHSLYFYLVHTYILTILTLFTKKYFLDFPTVVLLLINFEFLLIINTLVVFFIKKLPIVDKLFHGKLIHYPQKKHK